MIRRSGRWCAVLVATMGIAGCASEAPHARAAPDSVEDAPAAPPEPAFLRTLAAVPVTGFSGPGGRSFEVASRIAGSDAHLHRQIGMRTFDLPLRRPARTLSQYPCVTCHQGTTQTPGAAPAHGNIEARHPQYASGACPTCHVAGAVDHLTLPGGASTTLDHSYQLCAQCHFSQVNSWAAGAHGKRLVAWGGRRVVMSCADCHDPHRPGLEPRLPFAGPRIRRTSGGSR